MDERLQKLAWALEQDTRELSYVGTYEAIKAAFRQVLELAAQALKDAPDVEVWNSAVIQFKGTRIPGAITRVAGAKAIRALGGTD